MGRIIQKIKTITLAFIVWVLWVCPVQESYALTFIVTSDHHSGYNNSQKVVWKAIAPHRGAFTMTAGDIGRSRPVFATTWQSSS